jgi:hypothetical protein
MLSAFTDRLALLASGLDKHEGLGFSEVVGSISLAAEASGLACHEMVLFEDDAFTDRLALLASGLDKHEGLGFSEVVDSISLAAEASGLACHEMVLLEDLPTDLRLKMWSTLSKIK